ncbi:outer membrane beta-barrel protein [Maribacter ulvicola]|uniref:Outer membrane protein beta-barrel domain-containing protein n=1 Tax=Maribacter ulvicola TaxID=228959 RepID=A0A1N6PNW4_9FLAO|nr:outer membrane beta-barrel protein [Maribacter ulvicola]SIQ05852.1 Outer membrane protein beta-barrel domain-containing protein [Maribacter ulvicola]
MQNKNIDELFRDKLSNFKQTPDNKVWRKIDASLNKRKKKSIIPLWWSFSGIAAAILIGLLLFNPFTEEHPTHEILVDTENESDVNNDIPSTTETNIVIDATENNTNQIVEQTNTIKEEHSLETKNNSPNHQNNSTKVAVTHTKINANKNTGFIPATTETNKNALKNNTSTHEDLIFQNTVSTGIAKNDIENSAIDIQKAKETIAANSSNATTQSDPISIVKENTIAANSSTEDANKEIDTNKKSIFDEIEDQEALKKEKVARNRWSAGPNVAPVYFNALGEGSPVNPIFSPNTKSGSINMSYGVTVAYAVTKKLTIRSGINKVDYGYDTEDVAFSSSSTFVSNNGQLSSIDYAETSNTLTISSKVVDSEQFNTMSLAIDVTGKSPTREGHMSQQFGYLELPVELNYALINKKFGINLIGGVSSLFLINNAVSLTSGNLTTEIGEANNINNLNFSANMGLGLNYNFSQKVRFNVEPIFKYQLNTFSNINGTFRPYSLGVYSGLTFKF